MTANGGCVKVMMSLKCGSGELASLHICLLYVTTGQSKVFELYYQQCNIYTSH